MRWPLHRAGKSKHEGQDDGKNRELLSASRVHNTRRMNKTYAVRDPDDEQTPESVAFPSRQGVKGEGMKRRLGEIGVERGKRRSREAEKDSFVLMYSSRVSGNR